MIKKIFLIILILLTTGCADYKELNTLSYITAMGYDYVDDEFVVTYEVMDNKKNGQNVTTSTYLIKGSGKTTYEAHVDAASKLNKTAYYLHAQIILITENIIEHKLVDIMDSVIRNPKLNEEALLVITKDNTPEEIFSASTDAWPSASFYIYSLIMDNDYSQNYFIKMPFAVFTEKINTEKIDPAVSIIEVQDDELILTGSVLFNEDDESFIINKEESNLLNIFNDSNYTAALSITHDDKVIELASRISTFNFDVNKNTITLNAEILSEIKKSDTSIDLFEDEIYEKIAKKIEEKLNEEFTTLIKKMQKNNSDIFGFANLYYIKSRDDENEFWQNADIKIDITSTISRKGIVYNVG